MSIPVNCVCVILRLGFTSQMAFTTNNLYLTKTHDNVNNFTKNIYIYILYIVHVYYIYTCICIRNLVPMKIHRYVYGLHYSLNVACYFVQDLNLFEQFIRLIYDIFVYTNDEIVA